MKKHLFPCTFYGAKNSCFGTSLYALPPCPPLYDFSATPQSFLPPELEPLGFSSIGQLRVAS